MEGLSGREIVKRLSPEQQIEVFLELQSHLLQNVDNTTTFIVFSCGYVERLATQEMSDHIVRQCAAENLGLPLLIIDQNYRGEKSFRVFRQPTVENPDLNDEERFVASLEDVPPGSVVVRAPFSSMAKLEMLLSGLSFCGWGYLFQSSDKFVKFGNKLAHFYIQTYDNESG